MFTDFDTLYRIASVRDSARYLNEAIARAHKTGLTITLKISDGQPVVVTGNVQRREEARRLGECATNRSQERASKLVTGDTLVRFSVVVRTERRDVPNFVGTAFAEGDDMMCFEKRASV